MASTSCLFSSVSTTMQRRSIFFPEPDEKTTVRVKAALAVPKAERNDKGWRKHLQELLTFMESMDALQTLLCTSPTTKEALCMQDLDQIGVGRLTTARCEAQVRTGTGRASPQTSLMVSSKREIR